MYFQCWLTSKLGAWGGAVQSVHEGRHHSKGTEGLTKIILNKTDENRRFLYIQPSQDLLSIYFISQMGRHITKTLDVFDHLEGESIGAH